MFSMKCIYFKFLAYFRYERILSNFGLYKSFLCSQKILKIILSPKIASQFLLTGSQKLFLHTVGNIEKIAYIVKYLDIIYNA